MRLSVGVAAAAVMVAMSPVDVAEGHGRLVEPPSRATAWRYGFPTPHNYNDHELYCGGFSRQWNKNNGSCGICGDAWDQKTPRPHEIGGRFGQGVIVRKYLVNSVIVIRVELTANHNGYFEFRMCPNFENTTQDCLNENVLEQYDANVANDAQTKFYPTKGNQMYSMQYKLPSDLMCEHCVLQWRYIAGNNWGTCPNGTGLVGCGPQEEFRACADVAIGLTADMDVNATRTRPPYVFPTRKTTSKPTNQPTDAEEFPPSGENVWIGLIISAVMLFLVLFSLALFYLYYYRGGRRIKNLLIKKGLPPPSLPPVRPPRIKRTALAATDIKESPVEFKTDIDNNLEPGFETIRLNDHKI